MSRALVPVSEIASDICIHEIGDSTEKYHMAVMKWMAAGFKEMHLFMSPIISVKTVVMPFDNSVNMPCDFVYETKVGVRRVSDKPGRPNPIAVLWRNYHNLKNTNNFQSGNVNTIDGIINGSIVPDETFGFYNYNGVNVLDGYGVGIDPKGFYDLDAANGVINVGSLWPSDTEIVVEYKCDGISNGFELIPTEMVQAVKDYALWKYYFRKNDRRYYQSKDDYLTQYYMCKNLYSHRPYDYLARIFQNTPRQTINDLM